MAILEDNNFFSFPLKLFNQDGDVIGSCTGWVEKYKLSLRGFKCELTLDLLTGESETEEGEYRLKSLQVVTLTELRDYLLIGVFLNGGEVETLIGRFPKPRILKAQLNAIGDFQMKKK